MLVMRKGNAQEAIHKRVTHKRVMRKKQYYLPDLIYIHNKFMYINKVNAFSYDTHDIKEIWRDAGANIFGGNMT